MMNTSSNLSQTVTPKSTKRDRSLTGCSTCRRRHAKCDERHPSCLVCESQGIICEGYEINLIFDASSRHSSHCRRPLFSLEMRRHMTELLTTSAKPEDIDTLLCQVDDKCSNIEDVEDFSTDCGPFGAFSVAIQPAGEQGEQAQQLTDTHFMQMSSTQLTEVAEPATDMEGFYVDDPLMECLFWNIDMPIGINYDYISMTDSSPTEHETSNDSQLSRMTQAVSPTRLLTMPLPPNLAPVYAPALISHYRDVIIRRFSPISSTKTPWRVLHVPVTMQTLAQLNMGELATSSRMAIFYSILATSAISLVNTVSEQDVSAWKAQADAFFEQAQYYFRTALRVIITGEQKVRYKDMLIAFLCMSTLWAYRGNESKVERCLLDCEHWITMKGVPKMKKSHKVRLLHHCYLCSRTIYESTSVCRKPVFPANNPFGRFYHRQQWTNRFEQRMDELKHGPIVENDMHFEIPGKWTSSMYPDIYGIPEPLLFSLAHITRLANERQLSDSVHSEDALGLSEFMQRARSLERYICKWQPPTFLSQNYAELRNAASTTSDQTTQAQHDLIISHMIKALHRALIIYFYRRIYDADAAVMQDHVEHIRELLSECSQIDIPAVYSAGSFVWISFIAACEALSPNTQEWFLVWFDRCIIEGGLEVFQVIRNTAQEVWKRKNHGMCVGWPEILSETGQNLFYI